MSRITLQREDREPLITNQLVEDIDLFVELDQVFIEGVTLSRHLRIGRL